ncbi:hypothetical protein AB0L82_32005 [Nocardia sp. NPDC052001]|uniref:hypothetical protein n=1 Tax=Nocardia sp. NPDC052001 TaxID=3154853 RepID=UPI00341657F3
MHNPPLNPTQQHDILSDITLQVIPTMPAGWTRLVLRVMEIGRHAEVESGVKMADGTVQAWSRDSQMWREVWGRFMELRAGMYTPLIGTWVSVTYVLDPPGQFNIQYNRDEQPPFETAPSRENFQLEQQRFPRTPDHMPAWYRENVDVGGESRVD